MRRRSRSVIAFLSIALSCRTPVPAPPHAADPPTKIAAQAPTGGRATIELDERATEDGKLDIRIIDAGAAAAQLAVTPLADAELRPLLAKLEPLPAVTGPAPAMRPPSAAPAPSTSLAPIALVGLQGTAIPDTAPGAPPPKPVAPVVIGPLTPPELLPSGEVTAVSEVHVRFAEPMVPIAEVGVAQRAPATITPAVPGSWRWIDTRVATFTATTRFPFASSFTITVPAGTRALSGSLLDKAAVGAFSTPPIALERVGSMLRTLRPDAPLLLTFDQPFDPDVLVKFIRVEHAGKRLAFQTTTFEHAKTLWERDPRTKLDAIALPPHALILEPTTAWPAGATLKISLGIGAPSTEGLRTSTRETARELGIARPFTLRGISCGARVGLAGTRCPATSFVSVELSNSVAKYRADQVKLDGANADKDGGIYQVRVLAPDTRGKTHVVEVADLVDEFGQPLIGTRTASFITGEPIYDSALTAESGMFVLDPRFQIPQWKVEASAVAALRIQLYRVHPADYFKYRAYEQSGRKGTPPGTLVYDHQHAIGPRHAGTARVDLRPALDPTAQVGHVIGVATSIGAKRNDSATTTAWIQVTKLGVTARFDAESVQAWASQIDPARFLAPVGGAETTLIVDGRSERPAKTADALGHATLEFPPPVLPTPKRRAQAVLVVSSATDSVFQVIDRHERSVRTNRARWYVTDDRFTYKPKEPVYVKGWVRWTHDGVNPDLVLPAGSDTITWTLHDSKDAKLASGTAPVTPQGGFDVEAMIPDGANLGTARFTFETRGDQRVWPIQIEEFRTPTFSVSLDDDVTHRGAAPIYAGEAIELAASAKYYSGGGLAGARVRWSASLRSASYVPPGWEDFSFTPPSMTRHRYRYRANSSTSDSEYTSLSGASSSSIAVGIAAVPDGEPSVLQVDATVTDLDRATIRESSRPVIVHPSQYYVGIHEHPDREEFELIVSDVDGKAVPGVAIDVAIEGIAAAKLADEDAPGIVDTQHCTLTSATTPVACAWKRRDKDTAYSVLAKVVDARGRKNAARYHVPWWKREVTGPSLTIAVDKAQYRPGDVAKLEIHSAIVPAQAVVTIARQGVVAQRRIELAKETTVFELPIEAAFIRNVHVIVDRVAKRPTTTLPERASASVELKLDPEHGRLAVTTRATKPTVGPGERATFEVTVKHRGKPVPGAEVALLAVDEAVLAVSDKRHADPLTPFYFDVAAATIEWNTLDAIVDAGDEITKSPGFERVGLEGRGSGYGVGGGRGSMGGRSASVPSVRIGSANVTATRRDFRATAVWSPKLITDANGRALVTVTMPDSLTRFRIVALATAATRNFGKAESTIATQRPLNVRATAPRFLSVGDRFSLPVVVQNLDRTPRTIDVGVRAANLISSGPTGKRVTVPAGQRAELRFEFRAQARGRATIQTVAQSGELFDASQIDLPIYVPATTESFATYGIVDGDQPAFEQLAVPGNLIPDVGGIETDLFASQVSSLLDAFYYLQEYPFECAEQRSSRVLANAALVDVLDGFAAPGRPSRVEIDAQRARDLRELERDHQVGGWGYFWRTSVDPFVTQQVVAALLAAGAKGKWVDSAIADLAKSNLERIAQLERAAATSKLAGAPASTISLAAAELATLGMVKPRTSLALRLHAVAGKLGTYPVDAKARVLALLAKQPAAATVRKQLLTELLSAAREDASSATITTSYLPDERLLLVSAPKTTALVLDALIREVPQHTLIPKLARGLLDGRKRGRWMSTQENLAVLQAMRRYFDTYEKTAPDFVGKLWVGTAGYAEHAFAKRDARARVAVPWTQLPGASHTLAVAKTGPGRLYYRVGIQYAPAKLDLPPLDAGFVVRRSYRAVDRPSDVTRTPEGNYKVRLGAVVVVTLEVLSTSHRYAVALVDPLPAGFETVNTRLKTSEAATTDTSDWDHVNLRDNRSEGFAMDFREGSRRFTYTVRATTPGTFAAAPAKAEEMYSPETFGRTSGAMVTIE